MGIKIFGREPTAYLESLAAVAYILTGLGFTWWTDNRAGAVLAVVAAVAGFLNVALVRPVAPAVVKAIATTGFAALAEFGIHLNDRVTGGILLAIAAVLALQTRPQVTPASDPVASGAVSKANVPNARVVDGTVVR